MEQQSLQREDKYLSLWHHALRTQFGIAIKTSNPEALRRYLYAARAESGEEELKGLSLMQAKGEIWICHRA